MIRVRTLVATILPVVTIGGLVLSSVPSHAEAGSDDVLGFWPQTSDTATGSSDAVVAQADPRPYPRAPVPPPPAVAPVAPMPPAPPAPPAHSRHGRGMSVSIHDGKVEIDGIADFVQEQLDRAAAAVDSAPDVPPEMRDRLKGRIRAVRDRLRGRLSKLKSLDLNHLDQIGPELERMGDDLEKEMEELGKDLSQFGDQFGSRSFAQKFGKDFAKGFGPGRAVVVGPGTPAVVAGPGNDNSDDGDDDDDDDDDKSAVAMPPGNDSEAPDPADMAPALGELRKLSLDAKQQEQLAKLRLASDQKVASAKQELDAMSDKLHDALGKTNADADDIARQIDQISMKEADIRKTRVLAWLKVRKLLHDDQRALLESAAKKTRDH